MLAPWNSKNNIGAIGLLGGLVLLRMGWGIIRTARTESLMVVSATARTETGRDLGRRNLVATGIVLTIGNPYWLLWWATVGAAYYVTFSRFGLLAIVVVFLAGHLSLDLGWTTFLALVVGAGRKRVPDIVYRGALVACGLSVLAFGAYFIASGLRFLHR